MSAVGLAVLVLMGAYWVSNQFANTRFFGQDPIYTRGVVFTLVVAFFAILGYVFIGSKQGSVEFLIAAEGEMKKVNWSTRREILGSTWVVIGVTFFLAMLCFGFDAAFQFVFKAIDVLKEASDIVPPPA